MTDTTKFHLRMLLWAFGGLIGGLLVGLALAYLAKGCK